MNDQRGILFGEPMFAPHTRIHRAFEEVTKEHAYSTAVIDESRRFTYENLNADANQVARSLMHDLPDRGRLGQSQYTVAVLVDPSYERIVSLIAVLKTESAYLPLDVIIPPERCRYMLNEARTKFLLYSEKYRSYVDELDLLLQGLQITKRSIEELIIESKVSQTANDNNIHQDDKKAGDMSVAVMFTSGSTGVPKPVRVTHSNALNRLYWQILQFPLSKQNDDIGCHRSSLLFVDSMTEIFSCLLQGIPLVIIQREVVMDTDAFIQTLNKHRVTWLVLVPSIVKLLLGQMALDSKQNLPFLKYIISSGELLNCEIAREFFKRFVNSTKLLNFYGSTEVTGDVTFEVFCDVTDVSRHTHETSVSIGKPIANCNIYVVNDNGDMCTPGEIGELCVSGPNVTFGDVNTIRNVDGSVLPNRFCPSPGHEVLFRTGDFGLIKCDRLYYKGRKDSQVKIRGQRADLMEIDNVLNNIEGIDKAVALSCTRTPSTEHCDIVAFYVLAVEKTLDKTIIKDICKIHLLPYMIPKLYELNNIPTQSHTGKIDRNELRKIYCQSAIQSYDVTNPHSSQFLDIIAKILDIDAQKVQMSDSFFDLGGSSMNATCVVSRLCEAGFNVKVSDLIASKNLMQFYLSKDKTYDTSAASGAATGRYKVMLLSRANNKEDSVNLLAEAFVKNNPLDIIAKSKVQHLVRLIMSMWTSVLEDDLSIVVQDTHNGRIVAVSLVLDIRTTFVADFVNQSVAEINDAVETRVKQRLLASGERWMDAILTAVDVNLPPHTGLQLLHVMEAELIREARMRKYNGIVTVNSHPVTMMIAEQAFGYEVQNSLHVKSYVYEGSQPFSEAPDDYYIKCMLKRIS